MRQVHTTIPNSLRNLTPLGVSRFDSRRARFSTLLHQVAELLGCIVLSVLGVTRINEPTRFGT